MIWKNELRSDYRNGTLERQDLSENPFQLLESWLNLAIESGLNEPTAMCLSTVAPDGRPSSRFVLCRGISLDDPCGIDFYSNYLSRKGTELQHNPFASLVFWWAELEKQVRIEGRVIRLPEEHSDAYFASRPLESQAASAASPQSSVIEDRTQLESEMARLMSEGELKRPPHWGGYRLLPDYFEFWQGRTARLHDRFRYIQTDAGWQIDRLAP